MKRYGQIIRLKPEKYEEYKKLHAAVWLGVLEMIRKCNIRNYSIYYREGFLFAYFEYTGNDFEADMATMAADPLTKEWWKVTDPCQYPVDSAGPNDWWTNMEELFHTD